MANLKQILQNNNDNMAHVINEQNKNIKNYIDNKDAVLQNDIDDINNEQTGILAQAKYYAKEQVDNISTFGNADNEISLENNEINLHSDGSITLSSGTSVSSTLDIYNEEIAITTNKITINDEEVAIKSDIPTDIEEDLDGYKKETIDEKIEVAKSFATSEANTALQDAKTYVNSTLKDVNLEGYVKEEDLADELANYVKRSEFNEDGSVNLNADWNEIYNKPEILQDSNLNNIMTLDQHNAAISEINNNISNLSNEMKSKIGNNYTGDVTINGEISASKISTNEISTNGISTRGISANELNSLDNSSFIKFGQKDNNYSTISLSADGSQIEIYRGLSINSSASLTLTSGNNSISLNGNVVIPSSYNIVDENGNNRFSSQSLSNEIVLDKDEQFSITTSKGDCFKFFANDNGVGGLSVNSQGIDLSGANYINLWTDNIVINPSCKIVDNKNNIIIDTIKYYTMSVYSYEALETDYNLKPLSTKINAQIKDNKISYCFLPELFNGNGGTLYFSIPNDLVKNSMAYLVEIIPPKAHNQSQFSSIYEYYTYSNLNTKNGYTIPISQVSTNSLTDNSMYFIRITCTDLETL